ncbi:DUF4411 family protein [Pedobacter namyangjuensis]|uniref:DUF4411 family protein n=1 Tax=Pedobacter namyangjuensis TaxID=600626 RepID=UPI000DE3BE62|nr:DUF4411 family protein [Pedobacter namyangjuensis]
MIRAIMDTSSLLAIVRYYLPFDKEDQLKTLLQQKFESGELIITDKVLQECKQTAKGIVVEELDFITAKPALIAKTSDLLPGKKFHNMVDNQFCNKFLVKQKGITEVEFENEKGRFLASADASLILYALNLKSADAVVVTEETKTANDGKIFKKIPDNCSSIGVNCMSLPNYLKDHIRLGTEHQFSLFS